MDISLDASVSHRNSKLVLRDNTYSTIQWDAFSSPELGNFIQMLQREEELYEAKVGMAVGVVTVCVCHVWSSRTLTCSWLPLWLAYTVSFSVQMERAAQ